MQIDREQLIHFPCKFDIKVIALTDTDGENTIANQIKLIVEKHATCVEWRYQDSSTGKYQSFTFTIEAHSLEQIDNLYIDLNSETRVVMTL